MTKLPRKTMRPAKKARLERDGWKLGSSAEFLGLTPEESALIEMKLALADSLKTRRQQLHLTQSQVARQVGSSQSRVAKMEAGDAAVSLDLLVRALLALGASSKDVARIIASRAA